MSKNAPLTLADLRPAAYNPRTITDLALKKMKRSYERFGDLSGIIFNRKTGNIIGGHQRTRLFKNKSRIERIAHKDAIGTVAVGHVLVPREEGGVIKIPYREVLWDADKEKAANIAANSGGGEFDQVKLGRLLRDLENRRFDIEDIPMDGIDLKNAIRLFEANQRNGAEIPEEFGVIDATSVEDSLEYCCPRCAYRWSGAAKPSGTNVRHKMAAAEQKAKRAGAKQADGKKAARATKPAAKSEQRRPAREAAKKPAARKAPPPKKAVKPAARSAKR